MAAKSEKQTSVPRPGVPIQKYSSDRSGPLNLFEQNATDGISCSKGAQHASGAHRQILVVQVERDHGTRASRIGVGIKNRWCRALLWFYTDHPLDDESVHVGIGLMQPVAIDFSGIHAKRFNVLFDEARGQRHDVFEDFMALLHEEFICLVPAFWIAAIEVATVVANVV